MGEKRLNDVTHIEPKASPVSSPDRLKPVNPSI